MTWHHFRETRFLQIVLNCKWVGLSIAVVSFILPSSDKYFPCELWSFAHLPVNSLYEFHFFVFSESVELFPHRIMTNTSTNTSTRKALWRSLLIVKHTNHYHYTIVHQSYYNIVRVVVSIYYILIVSETININITGDE